MQGRDIIVVGASAGGVEALKILVSLIPADIPAAIFVVLHVPPKGTSILPQILTRSGRLPAHHAIDGETIRPGRIYVAPPDVHLMVHDGAIQLARGPKENGHRPSVDVLFRSATRVYGPRVAGVILSGALDDGSAGLLAVKRRGGVAVVQDPADALYPAMPLNALGTVEVDHTLPVAEMGDLLDRLARDPVPDEGGEAMPEPSDEMAYEDEIAAFDQEAIQSDQRPGRPSGFGCPDCGGSLWELHGDELVRFRCRVGHAWSAGSLIAKQSEALEEALWVALRALEERADLAHRLARRLQKRGVARLAARYQEQRAECKRQADLVREILLNPPLEVDEQVSSAESSSAEPGSQSNARH